MRPLRGKEWSWNRGPENACPGTPPRAGEDGIAGRPNGPRPTRRRRRDRDALKDRLGNAGFVTRNVTRDGEGSKTKPPLEPKSKRGREFRSGPGATRTCDLLLRSRPTAATASARWLKSIKNQRPRRQPRQPAAGRLLLGTLLAPLHQAGDRQVEHCLPAIHILNDHRASYPRIRISWTAAGGP
jgi:hypothetical protein